MLLSINRQGAVASAASAAAAVDVPLGMALMGGAPRRVRVLVGVPCVSVDRAGQMILKWRGIDLVDGMPGSCVGFVQCGAWKTARPLRRRSYHGWVERKREGERERRARVQSGWAKPSVKPNQRSSAAAAARTIEEHEANECLDLSNGMGGRPQS